MKKIFILMPFLIASATSLCAQNLTRERADAIVLEYLKKENVREPFLLYVNTNTPSQTDNIAITTFKEETFKTKYASWAYFVNEWQDINGPYFRRYLFINGTNENILEVKTSNDFGPSDLTTWKEANISTGLVEPQANNNVFFYPNPVDNLLIFPCTEEAARVEIYDLKGNRLLSEMVSGENLCQLNVSFLSSGTYMVKVSGETYKIIKK